jgi:hypothetical protein
MNLLEVLFGASKDSTDALPPPTQLPRRSEPCWCGSGKKYKTCHMPADELKREAERRQSCTKFT